MMGIVCRVIMRQIPPSCYKLAKGLPRMYPVYLPSAVCLSSSCINRRRINYGSSGKLDVDQSADDEQYVLPPESEPRLRRRRLSERMQGGGTEYISDEESSEGSTDDEKTQFNFESLPRRSRAARNEMVQCSKNYLRDEQKYLVKEIRNVRRILNSGIVPKKIFFTDVKDLNRLNSDLKGVKLFKIHECDVPFTMQGKSEPPFFAVVERRAAPVPLLEAPTLESIPLVIAYSYIRNPAVLCETLGAAMVFGCREILFKQSYDSLFNDHYVVRKSEPILRRMPSKFSQNFELIGEQFESNTCFYLLPLVRDSHCDLPSVNLHEVDFWKSKEIVLILTYSLSDDVLKLYESKKAQLITVNGANERLEYGSAAVGAVIFEIWRQWNAASKSKPKTKVNKTM